jgi:ABC-type transport system substrate-binding protein
LFALFNLILILLLAACGGTPASQVAAGSIAVVAFPTELPDYDPSTMSLVEPAVMFNVYQTLTFWTPDRGLVPQLATSWEANEDGSEWTFKLRRAAGFTRAARWQWIFAARRYRRPRPGRTSGGPPATF